MEGKSTISAADLEWLEGVINEIVKDDVGEKLSIELSNITSISELHRSCKTASDYYDVIDYLKKHPDTTDNDLVILFMDIREKYL